MTVNEILANFRQTLIALTPAFQKVNIPWRNPDAYDEWDHVASGLFNALVVEVLRWSRGTSLEDSFRMPKYDVILESYRGLCVLEVAHPALLEKRNIFHSFGTAQQPFDRVEVLSDWEDYELCSSSLIQCPVEGVQFSLKLSPLLGGLTVTEVITEELTADQRRSDRRS